MSTASGVPDGRHDDRTGAQAYASADDVVARRREEDERMLARARAVTEEAAEARRRRGPAEPLDAAELAAIEDLTSAPDAPAGYRLLRSRVESGATTWDAVIADTHQHGPSALRLKLAVMQRLYSREDAAARRRPAPRDRDRCSRRPAGVLGPGGAAAARARCRGAAGAAPAGDARRAGRSARRPAPP